MSQIVKTVAHSYIIGIFIGYAAMETYQEWVCEYIVCGWGHQTGQSQNAEPRQ